MLLPNCHPSRIGGFGARRLVCHYYSDLFFARANFKPAPMTKTGWVDSQFNDHSREASHCHHRASTMLILLHLFIDIMGDNALSVHSNSNDISELLFLPCLLPICLGLVASQNISVELSAEFIQTVDICAFCENSQTVEILHNHSDAIVRLFSRSFSIWGFAQKKSICWDIWYWADCSCKAIWYVGATSWEQLFWDWAVQLSFWIAEISKEADGRKRSRKDLLPVSNCALWARNLWIALELLQVLLQMEWRLRVDTCFCRDRPWSWFYLSFALVVTNKGNKVWS